MRCLPVLALLASLLAPCSPVLAEEVLKPTKAQTELRNELKKVPRDEKDAEERSRSIDYLARWEASGNQPTPTDRYALGQFLQSAGRYKEAAEHFRSVQTDPGCKENVQDYGASAEAAVYLIGEFRRELGAAEIDKHLGRLSAYAAAMAGSPGRSKTRATLMSTLARLQDLAVRPADALAIRMAIVQEDPKELGDQLQPILHSLLGSAFSMDSYAKLRTEAAAIVKTLSELQAGRVTDARTRLDAALAKLRSAEPDALGPDGRLLEEDTNEMSKDERAAYTAQRTFDTAEAMLRRVSAAAEPFALFGQPAPAWTLEHAHGEAKALADLKGKVVVLDFFATWADLCNFPVMRDLARDYASKGLQVVGVTATGPAVYESRYDIDEDRASRASGGLRYAARLATASAPANPELAILDEEAYRAAEIETIGTFKDNHGLDWPIVQIEKSEPRSKYAMEGWPHLVVLDKQGRVRMIRVGSLQRDNEAVVAALRKGIEALLAE